MAVILSMKGLLDCYQPGDRCRLCDGELAPPFLAWCGPCCRQIKRGLSSDLVHVAAIVELQMLGYPATTLDRRSVEEVDYEERSRWTRLSDNVVSLISPRDPDPYGPSTGLPTLTINLKGSQQAIDAAACPRRGGNLCAKLSTSFEKPSHLPKSKPRAAGLSTSLARRPIGVHVGYAVRSTCDAQHQGPSSKGARDAATSLIPIEGSAPC